MAPSPDRRPRRRIHVFVARQPTDDMQVLLAAVFALSLCWFALLQAEQVVRLARLTPKLPWTCC